MADWEDLAKEAVGCIKESMRLLYRQARYSKTESEKKDSIAKFRQLEKAKYILLNTLED